MAKKWLLAVLPFLFFALKISAAQPITSVERPVGVVWSPHKNEITTQEQLRLFSSMGIQLLQIEEPLSPPVWELISKFNFKIYALLPVRFPVMPAFGTSDSTVKKKRNHFLKQFTSHHSVTAIGLFAYGPIQKKNFRHAVSRYLASVRKKINLPIYYVTSRPISSEIDSLFDFKMIHVKPGNGIFKINLTPAAYYISFDNATARTACRFKKMLQAIHKKGQNPVFIDASLLLDLIKSFPDLKKTLTLYTSAKNYPIAVDEIDLSNKNQNSLIMILLLLAWALLAVTYYISPVYRRTFYRYFTGHQFYLIDVFDRHIRSVLPGISILTQQIVLTGIVFFCIGNSLISPLGREALFYHYPALTVLGESNFAFLFWGFAIAAFLEILCLCWLLIAGNKLKYFGQVLNLYPWLLQLNIVVVTIMVTVYLVDGSRFLLFLTGIIFLVITLAPFIISSVDIVNVSKNRQRIWVATTTLVLYIVLLTGLIVWIYLSPYLLNVVELALAL